MHQAAFTQILRREFAKRREKNSRYSMRAFAKTLKISQGALSEILALRRIPSPKLLKRLWEKLNLDPSELEAMLASAGHIQNSRGLKRLDPLYKRIAFNDLERAPKPIDLSIELYRVIAAWHHSALMELTFAEGFDSSPSWIAKALGIDETEASLAIERLLDLGILERHGSTLRKTSGPTTTADKQLTTPALRRHQKQLLEKSIESLERDSVEKRDHTGMTMTIDPDLLPEAKRRIQKFTEELMTFLESGRRSHVYQMQTSLFPLQVETNKEKAE